MVRSGVPVPTWVVMTRTEIWAPSTRCWTRYFPFNGWVYSGNYALWTRPDGSLWAVGISYYSRFGNGNANQYTFNDPQQLLSTGVSAVAAGRYHSLIVKSDGSLWSAGNNEYGQLGNGTTEDHDIWVKVVDANVTKVYASSHSSMFLKNDGTLWGMGNNGAGQLGDANTTQSTFPCNPTCLKWLMLALTIGQPMPLSPMVLFGKPI